MEFAHVSQPPTQGLAPEHSAHGLTSEVGQDCGRDALRLLREHGMVCRSDPKEHIASAGDLLIENHLRPEHRSLKTDRFVEIPCKQMRMVKLSRNGSYLVLHQRSLHVLTLLPKHSFTAEPFTR